VVHPAEFPASHCEIRDPIGRSRRDWRPPEGQDRGNSEQSNSIQRPQLALDRLSIFSNIQPAEWLCTPELQAKSNSFGIVRRCLRIGSTRAKSKGRDTNNKGQ
jgi:hypothetical protein